MHFVMSYSGGKDSALALWRLKCQGHQPVALLATYNPEQERSWFHGIPLAILEETAAAMSLPLLPCPCPPADYNASFERALARAKALGAEACAFGDIDIPDHRQWDEERCAAAGLSCLLPLWGEGRAGPGPGRGGGGLPRGDQARPARLSGRLLPGPDAGRGHPGRHRGHRRGYLRGKRGIPHPGHRAALCSAIPSPCAPARSSTSAPTPPWIFSCHKKPAWRIHCSWSASGFLSLCVYSFYPSSQPTCRIPLSNRQPLALIYTLSTAAWVFASVMVPSSTMAAAFSRGIRSTSRNSSSSGFISP